MDATHTDLTAPSVFDDPNPVYDAIRDHVSVHWNESLRGWVVTRHADVKSALKDARLSVEKLEPFAERVGGDPHSDIQVMARALADWMVFKDPPRQAELRRAMQNAFMARDTPVLEPMIGAIVDEMLDELMPVDDRRVHVDLVERFAQKVPSIVISDLFGLPREERAELNAWSHQLSDFVLASVDAADRRETAAAVVVKMVARFHRLIRDHRASHPMPENFTSLLLRDGAHLSDDEIVHTLILVLFAGHETTANLIASGMLTLIRAPKLMGALAEQPDLIEAAVEEFLRLDGPVHMVFRIAKQPVRYAGVDIPAGDRLYLVLNAANRDPTVFDRPDAVDLARRRFQHVSFGPGTHMCLGAPLARLVARIALQGLLARCAGFRLETDTPRWRRQLISHGLQSLPVSFVSKR